MTRKGWLQGQVRDLSEKIDKTEVALETLRGQLSIVEDTLAELDDDEEEDD
jgi:hypothetical protein